MLFLQNIIEFTNLKETDIRRNNHFRVEIWYKTEDSKTTSDLLDLGDWLKPIVGMYFELSMECRMKLRIQTL